jgi:hypothetical protein
MRKLVINISARPETDDNSYGFSSIDVLVPSIYQFLNLVLNYSVTSSSITSMLILGMSSPISSDNVLRSGQPVVITDNGVTVFQGVILTPSYKMLPIDESGQGGLYLFATLAPSIYQFTITPLIFDSAQAKQISTVTGLDVSAILVGGVTQSIATQSMLDYMVTNMDYNAIYGKSISASNLGDNIYVMTAAGEYRDTTIRSSIDYYNCVFYQQEDGTIIIRQLDPSIESPFDIDLQNSYLGTLAGSDVTPVAPLLAYEYCENGYSTPSVVSNYAMLSPDTGIGAVAQQCVLSYAPNPEFYPRIGQLLKSGWFTGQIGVTQINDNIVKNPTTAQALKTFQSEQDQYMITTQATGVKDQFYAAYQALLTAKQLGAALTGYSSIDGTISLDDVNLAGVDLSSVVGTCLQIQNCDMTAGLIATCSRNYSINGSFLTFSIVALGSYTGLWANSNFTPESA